MTRQQTSVLGAQPFLRGMPSAQLAVLAGLCEHVIDSVEGAAVR